MLNQKIDFVVLVEVTGANPNGDPLSGNMPRQDNALHGIMSDVCIKRKIRNRLQDAGQPLFVIANERIDDGYRSLEKRFDSAFDKKVSDQEVYEKACEKWFDVRAFGQVMTYQKRSIGIRGPVSITMAKSLDPVEVTSMQITRSTNGMEAEVGKSRSSDTMGSKHYVEYGLYKIRGSINPFFSEKTGFTMEDAESIKEALRTLFANDASSARPDGSMEVKDVFWFVHPNKLGLLSSAKTHDLIQIKKLEDVVHPSNYSDYQISLKDDVLTEAQDKGLIFEHIEGI